MAYSINPNVQLFNYDRPNRNRKTTSLFRFTACSWRIPTITSKPHHHPWSIPDEIIKQILNTREQLKRCAEVVWHYITTVLKIGINLSSMRRILRRYHCFDGARKKRVRSDNINLFIQLNNLHWTGIGDFSIFLQMFHSDFGDYNHTFLNATNQIGFAVLIVNFPALR